MKKTCCAACGENCHCGHHAPIEPAQNPANATGGSLLADDFRLRRLGVVMRPDPERPEEAEGVLNPAAVRGRDGELYLFPRLVGRGNFSRIGKARVVFNKAGDPVDVERLGIALEPTEAYELRGETGGCEDPRVTYFWPLDLFLMTYTAWGPQGPRIALAISEDLDHWERRGLVEFEDPDAFYCADFGHYENKDGMIFPEVVWDPLGHPALGLVHRPVYETTPCGDSCAAPCGIEDARASIWISYCPIVELGHRFHGGLHVRNHHCLAKPQFDWENVRIGGGPPPLLTPEGWLLIYHGVACPPETAGRSQIAERFQTRTYRAGMMVLSQTDPRLIQYQSPEPILEPQTEEERSGIVGNVVFPTGLDMRTDLGLPRRVDMYYGMADACIGAATFTLPTPEKQSPEKQSP